MKLDKLEQNTINAFVEEIRKSLQVYVDKAYDDLKDNGFTKEECEAMLVRNELMLLGNPFVTELEFAMNNAIDVRTKLEYLTDGVDDGIISIYRNEHTMEVKFKENTSGGFCKIPQDSVPEIINDYTIPTLVASIDIASLK